MNTAEHLVESYYRLCRGFFTLTDHKVEKGVGRQIDLLAVNLKSGEQLHIEVAVTHRLNWCQTIDDLNEYVEKKFLGAPSERKGKSTGATDFEKGKQYFTQIEASYAQVGFDREKVKRVVVCWIVKDQNNSEPIYFTYHSKSMLRDFNIEVLSLRDIILPSLLNAVGTANYDDEMLRMLAFIKQRDIQTPK